MKLLMVFCAVLLLCLSLTHDSFAEVEVDHRMEITLEDGNKVPVILHLKLNLEAHGTASDGVIAMYRSYHPNSDLKIFVAGPEELIITQTESEAIIIDVKWEYIVNDGEEKVPCRDMEGELTNKSKCFITAIVELAKEFYLPYVTFLEERPPPIETLTT